MNDIELSGCTAMLLVVLGGLGGGGLIFGLTKGWLALWEHYQLNKLRAKLDKWAASLVALAVIGLVVFGLSHTRFVDCGKSDSVSRAIGVKEPVRVAGLPCTCGCGKHK